MAGFRPEAEPNSDTALLLILLSQGGAFGGKESKPTMIALPVIVAAHKLVIDIFYASAHLQAKEASIQLDCAVNDSVSVRLSVHLSVIGGRGRGTMDLPQIF